MYVKENPPSDKSIPGPGQYVVKPKFGNESQKYSLYGRNANHSKYNIFNWTSIVMLTSARFNPGPGAYEPKTTITPTGEYFVSSMKNSKAPHFSLPKVIKSS